MKDFNEWMISDTVKQKGAEIYSENFIGIRHEHTNGLEGKTVYTVIENDEENGLVTIQDEDGKEYTFEHEVLAKALSENSKANGFQTLQYPVGYLLSTSGTALSNLSIYDPRLKNPYGKK